MRSGILYRSVSFLDDVHSVEELRRVIAVATEHHSAVELGSSSCTPQWEFFGHTVDGGRGLRRVALTDRKYPRAACSMLHPLAMPVNHRPGLPGVLTHLANQAKHCYIVDITVLWEECHGQSLPGKRIRAAAYGVHAY
jgi:hypothetical protein